MMKKKSDEVNHAVSTYSLNDFSSTATLTKYDQIKLPKQHIPDGKNSIKEKEYDPYGNRELEHPNTFLGAVIHVIKGSLGTGIIAVPRAFKTAGLVAGLFGTILTGIICTYAVHLLVSASLKICVRTGTPRLGYPETVEEVFRNGPRRARRWAQFARIFVEVALALTYNLSNAVYVVFISESLTKLVSFYHPPAAEWGQYFQLLLLLPLILCCQIRELKHLVPFSFFANVSLVIAFGITFYYMFSEIKHVNIADRHLYTNIYGIPSFFSTVLFAMEGIGAIMPVENSMVTPRFIGCPGVLNTAMTWVIITYTTIGFFGYYTYGEATHAAITQNLPSNEVLAQVVQVFISMAMYCTFMLNHYVPADLTWKRMRDSIPPHRHNIAQITLRTVTVIFAVGVAAAAGHHLDGLIDLIGAVFFATLGLLVPPLLDIMVNWKNWGSYNWILLKDLLILLVGLFALICGSYYAAITFLK